MTNHDKEKGLTTEGNGKTLTVRHDNQITQRNALKLYTMAIKYINVVLRPPRGSGQMF